MTKKYYKCCNEICGKRYASEAVLKRCPICKQAVTKGIDIIDVIITGNYVMLDSVAT